MLKVTKKRIISVICLLMLASSVTACKTASVKTTPGDSESTVKPGDPFGKYSPAITVKAVRTLDSTTKFVPGEPDRDSLEKNVWAAAYEEQLGIKLNYLWTPPNADQYAAKWNVSVASNDIPDVGAVDSKTYKMLVEGGLVEDMTKVFENYASPDFKKAVEADGGVTMKYSIFDGKLMGLPLTGAQPDNSPLLFVRRDWLKAVNLSEPKTIEDLIKVAQAFAKNKLGGDGTYGLCISKEIDGGVSNISGFLNGFGAYYNNWIKDKSGNLVYGSVQPEMKSALQKLQTLYKEGLLSKDFAVKDGATAAQDVAAGKVGMTYGVFWAPGTRILDNIKADPKADWMVIPIPTLDGSDPKPQASATPGSFFFVKKGMKNPEAAVKLLNMSYKLPNENYNKYGTGTDSFAYSKFALVLPQQPWLNLNRYLAADAAIRTGDESKFPNDLYKSSYTAVKAAMAGDRKQFNQMLIFGQQGTFSVINKYKEKNQIVIDNYQALPTPTMLSKGDTLRTSLDAALLTIIMGDNIDNFDKAVANWKSMGGNDITKEVNDWYKKNK